MSDRSKIVLILGAALLCWVLILGAVFTVARAISPQPQSVVVTFGDRLEIERICTERVGSYAMACALVGSPRIWIQDPCYVRSGWYAVQLCHELRHVNGWPAHHPEE